MSILDKARSHYQSILSGELQSVEVPEWETTIYFKPINNFAVEEKIIKLHGEGKLVEALVETLLLKALDENGNKMFRAADRVTLMKEVDPAVIIRVVTQMNETTQAAKEAMGN